jgi:hypothetical protein
MDNAIYGSAKAWVNFNPQAGSITVNSSYNVSSVTYSGVGYYVVNFTNAFSDNKYASVGAASPDSSGYTCVVGTNETNNAVYSAQTTTTCPVAAIRGYSNVLSNPYVVCVSFFR